MEQLIHKIVKDLRTNISAKYKLHEMRVFGSSARGDRRADSDIDVFVRLSQVNREIGDVYLLDESHLLCHVLCCASTPCFAWSFFFETWEVKGYYNRELIKTGILPMEMGRLYNKAFEYRQKRWPERHLEKVSVVILQVGGRTKKEKKERAIL
ncbi:MAG: nucleotidyltransferase domain-containing protein [Desulfobacterales bacterium]|nr:nucleotidyltransferase domain-containing protein [Desulfobacterales bacterium]